MAHSDGGNDPPIACGGVPWAKSELHRHERVAGIAADGWDPRRLLPVGLALEANRPSAPSSLTFSPVILPRLRRLVAAYTS